MAETLEVSFSFPVLLISVKMCPLPSGVEHFAPYGIT